MSARVGPVVLVEYLEEFPLLVANRGMGCKIITYYRQEDEDDEEPEALRNVVGAVRLLEVKDDSPLPLGDVEPGTSLTTMTNNMFVAPLVMHKPPADSRTVDFLLCRKKGSNQWFIRAMPPTYVCGQLQPLIQVPVPHSKRHTEYSKSRLEVFVYREFQVRACVRALGPRTSAQAGIAFFFFFFFSGRGTTT